MSKKRYEAFSVLALIFSLLLSTSPVQAKYIGGDPPYCCKCENRGVPCPDLSGGSAISLTEGNLREQYHVSSLRSAFGATIDFSLAYNAYNADGSRAQVDTGLGYGWTHSYNIFLFSQRGHMFRMGGDGRGTRYQLGPGGTFTAAPGYFETLVKNPDGSFTLRQKDGTVFTFASIPNTPFLVGGPVYRLTRIVDRNNNITELFYTNGDLDFIRDTYGRILDLSYFGNHKLAAVIDPLGRTTTLAYDSTGRKLSTITDPEGKSIRYSYNFLYQLIRKVDRDGRIFSYVYNSQGKPVAIRDGAGHPLFSLTNPVNWATNSITLGQSQLRDYIPATTTKTDGRGNVWKYDYDSHGYITRIVAPDGAITIFTYDDPGTLMLASVTDANGRTTTYEYDAQGNRTKMTDALGHMTTYTYEPVFNMMTSMTDPDGRTTTYDYDARGNRIRETDPLGHTREWTYDAHGNVLTEKDKNGNFTAYEYDAFGNRAKTTDALGNVTEMTYDAVGNLVSRTDANGHTTTFEYDLLDRLVRKTDPLGGVTHIIYDGSGNRIQVLDCNGNSTRFAYDLRQRLVQTTDALGQMTTTTYDRHDNRTATTDTNGHTTTFQYDVQNRLIQITDALGQMTTTTYDGVGNKLTETDANGHTTTFAYDALNRLVMKTDAVGCVTVFEYDMVGLPGCPACTGPTLGSRLITKQTDGNGQVTYFKYDGLDRLIKEIRKEGDTSDIIDASDAVTAYTYDPHGNRLSITEPNGNTTTYAYDALNRRTQETNAAGDMTIFTYDGVGNVITIIAPNGNVTTNSYDAKDRLMQVEDLVGLVARYTYDCIDNRLSETDGNANTTTFTYDVIYRLIKGTDPLGEMTLYAYDPVGNLLKLTDREGHMTTHTYDAINRRLCTTDALGNAACSTYDGVGNLLRVVDANGHATDYAYDGVNRRIKETYADGGMRTFTYDCVGNVLTRTDQKGQTTNYVYNDLYFLLQRNYPVSVDDTFTYDLAGRMRTAERGGWLVTFEYDGANRVTRTTQHGKVIRYVYKIPGRTRTITYPGGRVVTDRKDLRDRLSAIDDLASPPPIAQYVYDLGNRVTSRTYRNDTVATYTYNANNWVTALEHILGVTRVAGFGHAHDKEGNKRFEDKRHAPSDSEAYQYDAIYRFIDFKVGTVVGSTVPVPLTQTQYTLDPVGNWEKKTTDGMMEIRMHDEVNELIKIDAQTLLYDDNGNLIDDGTYTYAYDEENRLIRVTRLVDSQVVGQYQYDALSRRVVKQANPAGIPTETRYFYDDARIIEEQDAAMVTQATYVYGNYMDEVLTMDRAGQTYYYHQNALWSVAAVTDSAANVVERYAYDAYGCVTISDGAGAPVPSNPWDTPHSAIGNPYMFTGRQLDEETGLYYYRARYYDCVKGRFLQRDPLGYVDGMNLYEYARSNPVMRLDPLGQKTPEECCKEIKTAGKDNGDLGGVVCCPCDGDPPACKKVSCVWIENRPTPNEKAKKIISQCAKEHEDDHHDDVDCPNDKNCPVTRPLWKAGKVPADEEKKAYKKEFECLERLEKDCGSDAACKADVQRRKDFVESLSK